MCETIALDPTKYLKKKQNSDQKQGSGGWKALVAVSKELGLQQPKHVANARMRQSWSPVRYPESGEWGWEMGRQLVWFYTDFTLSAPSCKGVWRLFVDSEHQQLKAHLGSIPNTHLFFHMSISSITVPQSQPRAALPTGALCLQRGIGAQLCFVPQLLSLCSLGMGPAVWWDPGGQRNENRGRASGGTDHLCLQPWAISPSPCAKSSETLGYFWLPCELFKPHSQSLAVTYFCSKANNHNYWALQPIKLWF